MIYETDQGEIETGFVSIGEIKVFNQSDISDFNITYSTATNPISSEDELLGNELIVNVEKVNQSNNSEIVGFNLGGVDFFINNENVEVEFIDEYNTKFLLSDIEANTYTEVNFYFSVQGSVNYVRSSLISLSQPIVIVDFVSSNPDEWTFIDWTLETGNIINFTIEKSFKTNSLIQEINFYTTSGSPVNIKERNPNNLVPGTPVYEISSADSKNYLFKIYELPAESYEAVEIIYTTNANNDTETSNRLNFSSGSSGTDIQHQAFEQLLVENIDFSANLNNEKEIILTGIYQNTNYVYDSIIVGLVVNGEIYRIEDDDLELVIDNNGFIFTIYDLPNNVYDSFQIIYTIDTLGTEATSDFVQVNSVEVDTFVGAQVSDFAILAESEAQSTIAFRILYNNLDIDARVTGLEIDCIVYDSSNENVEIQNGVQIGVRYTWIKISNFPPGQYQDNVKLIYTTNYAGDTTTSDAVQIEYEVGTFLTSTDDDYLIEVDNSVDNTLTLRIQKSRYFDSEIIGILLNDIYYDLNGSNIYYEDSNFYSLITIYRVQPGEYTSISLVYTDSPTTSITSKNYLNDSITITGPYLKDRLLSKGATITILVILGIILIIGLVEGIYFYRKPRIKKTKFKKSTFDYYMDRVHGFTLTKSQKLVDYFQQSNTINKQIKDRKNSSSQYETEDKISSIKTKPKK